MGDGLFGDLPAIEVPLSRAPLKRVLAQVRFPSVPDLALPEGQHRFTQSLRSLYPIARQQSGINLVIGPEGVTQQASQSMVWQLHSKDEEWQVSFSDGFVALETKRYTSRQDFCKRFTSILESLSAVAEPVMCDRIGIRYINQVSDREVLENLDRYLQAHVLGGWGLSRLTERATLLQSVNESLFSYGADKMLVRTGWIPAGRSVEPTIPVLDSDTWVLDLDSFVDTAEDFSADHVARKVRDLADAAYSGFRTLVKEEFLKHYS
ncbi:TIGR04255 family protein [Streptomyces sp. NPDC050597]|uniref:TIGR04255 family protein n=1 Tax=Streptomyces sp. NPDC050597 TaxID=3157212 RepID=UPI0034358166